MNDKKKVLEARLDFFGETPFDDDVKGCYVNNFGNIHVCGGFQSSGCKHLARCKTLQSIERRAHANVQTQ